MVVYLQLGILVGCTDHFTTIRALASFRNIGQRLGNLNIYHLTD